MSKIYCLPLGATQRDSFVDAARQYEYGQALLVVPSRFIMDKVRQQGNVRSVIIDYLPNAILRCNHSAANYTRISRLTQELVVQDLVQRLKSEDRLRHFAAIANKEGFIQSLASFMGELARANVSVEEFHRAILAWDRAGVLGRKDRELDIIYHCYRAALQQTNSYDIDGLYRLAIAVLAKEDSQVPWQALYFTEFYQLDALQGELIRALSQKCEIHIGLSYDSRYPELQQLTATMRMDLLGYGFEQETVPPQEHAVLPTVTVTKLLSQEDEMRSVLGSIKEQALRGADLKDMLLVVRHLDDYDGLYDLCQEYGIPINLPKITKVGTHPIAQLLNKILLSALQAWDVTALQQLLAEPLLSQLYGFPQRELEQVYSHKFFATTQQLREFVLTTYGDSRIESLFKLIDALQLEQTVQEFAQLLTEAITSWQLPQFYGACYQQGQVTLEELKALVLAGEACCEGVQALVTSLEQLSLDRVWTLAEYKKFYFDYINTKTILLKSGSNQGLTVIEAGNVQGVHAKYVYLMGLRDGQFPALKHESWLYNDSERSKLRTDLGIELPYNALALLTDKFFFASILLAATQEVHLSYYEDDAAGASEYLNLVSEYLPVEVVPQEGNNSLANYHSTLELAKYMANLASKDTNLDVQRFVGESPYNGYVPEAPQQNSFSATMLNNYVTCPFMFLGQNVWRLQEWEKLDEAIKYNIRGEIYHRALAKFLSAYIQQNLFWGEETQQQEELKAALTATLEEMVAEGKLAQTEFTPFISRQYQEVLYRWLRWERVYLEDQEKPFEPLLLETSFGDKSNKVSLRHEINGRQVTFRGQIDRVDVCGDKYLIIDYKSGGVPTNSSIVRGENLQLPLYALALEQNAQLAQKQFVGAGYCSLQDGKRKNGMWLKDITKTLPWFAPKARPANMLPIMEQTPGIIERIITGIDAGFFPVLPSKACPEYCPYKDICRHRVQEEQLTEEGGGTDV